MGKEIIGTKRITFYPQEIYAIHYKDMPFSIGNLSYKEQIELGIRWTSEPNSTRKCYFTKGHAITGIKKLPKCLQDKVEIVKYVPENSTKENNLELFNGIKEQN